MKANAIVIGAGAAGCFAALQAAEAGLSVTILERGKQPLTKVRISGGGRCNVTHACFDPLALVQKYPRGNRELLGPFHHFQPAHTLDWFRDRGVEIKEEKDGRMFPVTDSSSTIIDCFLGELDRLGVKILYGRTVDQIHSRPDGTVEVILANGESLFPESCLLAAGSLARSRLLDSLTQMGHTIVPPVPSLFTFRIPGQELKNLAGLSVPTATVTQPESGLTQSGPLLVTHWGLSGPAILKLSAWGARELHAKDYKFSLDVRWTSEDPRSLRQTLDRYRHQNPKRQVANLGPECIPRRLWERFALLTGAERLTWGQLPADQRDRLIHLLFFQRLQVIGKSTHKEEFVTCGGVSLKEVNFQTMESRLCPGLFFAGESLDIDGVTGGYNFQAAWTTGYLAGRAMAKGKTA